MKSFVLLWASVFSFIAVFTNAQELAFVNQYGGIGEDRPYGQVADQYGNVYVTGIFAQSILLGPNVLTSQGDNDIFIAKFDSNGVCTWSTSAGGPEHDRGVGINLDKEGNVYVTGIFKDTSYFQHLKIVSAGNWDMFIAKYDTAGRCVWVSRGGGTDDDRGADLIISNSGSIYLTGWFRYAAQFGAYPVTSNGHFDCYLAKYTPDGKCAWIKNYGGPGFDKTYSIDLFADSVIYLSGYFLEEADFDSIHLNTFGIRDAFLVKLDTFGNVVWVEQSGGPEYDRALDAKTDRAGNIFLTGHFRGQAWFDDKTVTSKGDWDVFTAKYDQNGKCLWVRRAGGPLIDKGESIQVDDLGNIYVSGIFEDTADFQHYSFTSGFLRDAFVVKYDTAGILLWASQGWSTQDVLHVGLSNPGPAGLFMAGDYLHKIAWDGDTLSNGLNMNINLNRIVNCVVGGPPTLNPAGTVVICPGDSVQLNTNGNFLSYIWSNGETGTATLVQTAGQHHVIAVDSAGCMAASSMILTYYPSEAIVTPGNDLGLCQGDSVILSANPSNVNLWNNGDTSSSITVNDSGVFWIDALDSFGCWVRSDSIYITILPLPEPSINVNGPTTFCTGNSVWLNSNHNSGNLWNNGFDSCCIEIDSSGLFSLEVTDSLGCSGYSDTVVISVQPLPVLQILVSGETEICPGDSVWLTAQTSAQVVNWNIGSQNQTILITDTGQYWVIATNSFGCNVSDSVDIKIKTPSGFTLPTSPWAATFQTLGIAPVWQMGSGKEIKVDLANGNGGLVHEIHYTVEDVCPPRRRSSVLKRGRVENGGSPCPFNLQSISLKRGSDVKTGILVSAFAKGYFTHIRFYTVAGKLAGVFNQDNFNTIISIENWLAGIYFFEVLGECRASGKLVITN